MPQTAARRFALLTTALAGILLGSASIAGPAAASTAPPVQLSLKPVNQPGSYFELLLEPGQTEEYEVELGNHGPKPIAARTYAADAHSITNGGFGAEGRDGTPSTTTTWVSYPTEVLQLDPEQANIRTFSITVPADTAPGQYITSLVLENDAPLEGSGGVALDQVIRQAVAVSIRVPGPLNPGFAFGAAGHKVAAAHSVVIVELSNTGNANVKPTGGMTIKDASGKTVSEAPVAMGSVYAHDATRVETTLASILNPGDYTLDITLTDAATKVTGTGTALPFTVTAEEVQKARAAQPAPLPGVAQDTGPGLLPYLFGTALIGLLVVLLLVFRRKRMASTRSEEEGSARTRRGSGSRRRH
ncbi:WxL protein peptidoglycan domain-containing protein [Mycetocola miduiensis]|uniref:WxL Interacting Protein peptidoglycan binding domain-containing protein n=1 Tax=Mycetocola miduiensis TaxID=995034 RepID=A0A1I5CUT1_9MICO|nr:DUF916 domain-containing protein [Mycetocola miduiensis]SFN90698.1 protein of unknown function [Mycetocola miduiensis]